MPIILAYCSCPVNITTNIVISLMFKFVEDEASATGYRVASIFEGVFDKNKDKSDKVSFSSNFAKTLDSDTNALREYKKEVAQTGNSEEAFINNMRSASTAAQEYVKTTNTSKLSVADFTKQQKMADVSLTAQSKSFKSNSAIIKEYNDGCKNVGLSQKNFVTAVQSGNSNLGNYLSGLNGAKATMGGYATQLGLTAVKTVALNAASTALSMGISMVVGWALSAAIQKLDEYIHAQEHAIEASQEAANKLANTRSEIESLNSELDEINSRITELQSKDSLTLIEEEELSKLERAKELTESKLDVRNSLESMQQKTSAQKANFALTRKETVVTDYEANPYATGTYNQYNVVTEQRDIIDKAIAQQTELNELQEQYNDKLKKHSEHAKEWTEEEKNKKDHIWDTKTAWEKEEEAIEDLEKKIEEATESSSENIKTIDEQYRNLFDENGNIISGYEDTVAKVRALYDMIGNSDNLTEAGKQAQKIQNFFDGSTGKNQIYDYLKQVTEEGGSASEAITALGYDLDSLGIKDDYLNRYFKELVDSINAADDAASKFDGSVQSVDTAFDSTNQGAVWDKMAGYAKTAAELYKNGQVGTDDFQSYVEWASPLDVSSKENLDKFKYDAEAYVDAYKDVSKKLNTYFQEDKQASAKALQDKLIDSGLAVDKGNEVDFTDKFKSSKDAADALGLSIQATEVALHNLEEFGYEFDGITFDGEELENYKNNLDNIHTLYDEMLKSDSADSGYVKNLGKMIEGWDENYQKCEKDLSNLDHDQIVHIEFVYDLATIQKQIDELKATAENSHSTNNNANVLAAQSNYLATAKDGLGFNNENFEIPTTFKVSDNSIKELQEQLKSAKSEDEVFEIQAKITNEQDLQKELLDKFTNTHPEITPETDTKTAQKALNDFLNQKHKIDFETELDPTAVKNELSSLGEGSTITFKADIDENGVPDRVAAIKKEDGEVHFYATLDSENVKKEVETVEDENGEITFTANVSGKEEVDSLKESASTTDSDKSLNITAKVSGKEDVDDLADSVNQFPSEGKSVSVTAKTSGKKDVDSLNNSIKDVKKKDVSIDAKDKATSKINAVKENNISDKPFNIIANDNASSVIASINRQQLTDKTVTITTIRKTVDEGAGSATGTAYSRGTFNFGKAFSDGTIDDDINFNELDIDGFAYSRGTFKNSKNAFAHGDWGTKNSGVALGGELGRELIVRDGHFFTIGDDSAEFFKYKRGDIIFNHKQTEEILNNGKILYGQKRGKALAEGNAFGGGLKIGGTPTPTNNKKKTNTGGNSHSRGNNNSTTNNNDNNDKSNDTDKKLEKFNKWVSKLFDWIEVKLDRVKRKIDNAIKSAEYNVEKENYSGAKKNYRTAINQTGNLITANQKGEKKYRKQANKVLNKAVKTGIINKKQAKSIKRKVKNGTIKISKYGDRMQAAVKAYKDYYDKALKCSDATLDLKKSLDEYYKSLYNLPLEKAATAVEKLANKLDILSAKASAVQGGGEVYNRVVASNAQSRLDTAKSNTKKKDNAVTKANKTVLSKQKTLLKDKGLSKAQRKSINSGKKISTKGLTGKALKDAKAYNKAIKNQTTAKTNLRYAKQNQKLAQKAYDDAKKQQDKYSNEESYKQANAILDQETKLARKQNNANQTALKEARQNYATAKAQKDKLVKKRDDAKDKRVKRENTLSKTIKNSKGISKKNKEKIQNAIKKGTSVNTKGLSGKALKQAKSYNAALAAQKKAQKALKDPTKNAAAAQKAYNEAVNAAAKSQAEYTETLRQNSKAKLENIENSYQSKRDLNSAKRSNKESKISLKQSNGQKVTRKDYESIISDAKADVELAQKEKEVYEKQYKKEKANLNAEDRAAAEARIQELKQAVNDAQIAVNDYVSQSIQVEIDNVQAVIDKLQVQQELLSGFADKNSNIKKQINEITKQYDLMIEQEKDATKIAQLKFEKEKAIRDLMLDQLSNIEAEKDLYVGLQDSIRNVVSAQNELSVAQGKDSYASRIADFEDDRATQLKNAATIRADAEAYLKQLEDSYNNGIKDDNGNIIKISKDEYNAGMTTYNNMMESAYKAETQAANDLFEAWRVGLTKLQDELKELEHSADVINAKVNLKNTRGIDTTAQDYRTLISNSQLQIDKLNEENELIREKQATLDSQSEKYLELQDQLNDNEVAIINAKNSQEEWNNSIAQLPYDKYEKALSLLDAIAANNKSLSDLKSAQGTDLSELDYQQQIIDNDKKIIQYENQRSQAYRDMLKAESDADGVYGGKTADEWKQIYLEADTAINDLQVSNEELKDSLRDDVYWREFERMHKEAERVKTVLDGLKDLIDEDMLFDEDGKMTDFGVAQVANLVKEYENAQDEVNNYSKDLANLNDLYQNGWYTQDEYNEKLQELQNGLLDSASAMKSYIDEIINLNKNLAQSELDDLFKLIDARKDALNQKKAYVIMCFLC